jgi:hypothetical protein
VREQHRDVVWTFRQRRNLDWDDAQAEQQILAHRTTLHGLEKVCVARRNEPDVGVTYALFAEPPILLLLDEPEQLGLIRWRERVYLVEEQRAAVRRRDQAISRALRASKRTTDVTEQLVFEELVDERRAVDRE